MDDLQRNQTTAQQAENLEEWEVNPLRDHELHSSKYFQLLESRRRLPVSLRRQEFLDIYHDSQIILVSGETGSGKTTQVPQSILFDEWASGKKVACTQPRRLATTAVATRTAAELDVTLGEEVGYSVRFERKTSKMTRLKYMTGGLLLSEASRDRDFSAYLHHSRRSPRKRLNTNLLVALLKMATSRRSCLKVVIMSATLNVEKIQSYFPGAATFEMPGKVHPVEIHYLSDSTPRYCYCAITVVQYIHENMDYGDILLFLPTSGDIEMVCSILRKRYDEDLAVLPLYSALSRAKQQEIFEDSEYRKCIVATNVAETSITIDGIVYVVDSGLEIRPVYNPRLRMSSVLTCPISKASAKQRAGRAGRTQPGICFRLYTGQTHDTCFIPSVPPGILEGELASQILLLKVMGFESVGTFDFLDPPHPEVYLCGLQDLCAMGYIDDRGTITPKGRIAARLSKNGCLREMIDLAAISSTQHPIFSRPPSAQFAANIAHQRFACPLSDHISQLNALHAYESAMKTNNRLPISQWCFDAFLNRRALSEVVRIRDQLLASLQQELSYTKEVCGFEDAEYDTHIRKTLARSFFYRVRMANSRARFCLTDASTDYRVLLIEPGMHLLKKKRLHFRQGLAWYHLGYGYSPYEFDGKTMINKDGRDSCHAEKSI
uniref:RNA helicase n=1 Tax=Bionectria ochroleuca TaxID=29856 RepID=A0A8H7N6K9_BIOOC